MLISVKTAASPDLLNRRRDRCGIKSTGCDVLSMSFTILNHYFLWIKRKKKNNRQQKQPTQETVFNRHYPRNTVKTTKKKKENNANIEFLTCHIVPWAGFLSQKAIYVTSFYSNKNNRHLKWLPAD